MARTVAIIGDRWTLMILRDCFLRVRRFEDFQARLGITRPLLASRLKMLVDELVLVKVPYQERPLRHEYRLTPRGLDLYPVMMCSECGEPLAPRQIHVHPGPGAADPAHLPVGKPTRVAGAVRTRRVTS